MPMQKHRNVLCVYSTLNQVHVALIVVYGDGGESKNLIEVCHQSKFLLVLGKKLMANMFALMKNVVDL